MPPKRRKPKIQPAILLFWTKGADAAAASIFVTELRSSGLAVKIVGLRGTKAKSNNGITLLSDMTLIDAMNFSHLVPYIILPFGPYILPRLTNDSRLWRLFDEAHDHGTIFIESEQIPESSSLNTAFGNTTEYRVLKYPPKARIYEFIEALEMPVEWPAARAVRA